MLLTIGMISLGLVALFSMIMMIGNVIKKSPFGKGWATLGFVSVFLAGGLLGLQMFMPPVTEKIEAAHEEEKTSDPEKGNVKQDGRAGSAAVADKGQDVPFEIAQPADASGGELSGSDAVALTILSNVMEYLKQGKPVPEEYLAMLPDGGQSFKAAQSGTSGSSNISKPLQTQLVSIQRSEGKTQHAGNSYVPTKPSTTTAPAGSGTSSGSTKSPAPTPAPAPSPAPSNEDDDRDSPRSGGSSTQPDQMPVPTPAPAPTPVPAPAPAPEPAPQPPAQTTPSLLNGGLLKPLLGKSKTEVDAFMQYNQSLGSSGNTYRYLHGVTIVEVTYSGNTVSRVKLQFNQFTPQGQSVSYYEDYLRGIAGMTNAGATSRSGGDISWANVYPGASSIKFHIDTRSNFGYVEAVR